MRLSDELHAADAPQRLLWEVLWESRDPVIRPLVQALHAACDGDYELTTIALDWESSSSMLTAVEVYASEWTDTGEPCRLGVRQQALVTLIVEVHRQLGRLLDLLRCDHPELRLAAILALGTDANSPSALASPDTVGLSESGTIARPKLVTEWSECSTL